MADFAGGEIQAFVGPTELGAADDLESVIVGFIAGAQASLDIAVQELDSENIAQAILDARWRGLSVRVFLEYSYLQTDLTADDISEIGTGPKRLDAQWVEDRPAPDFRTNRDILAALLRTDIEVHSDFNQEIFHQKFVIPVLTTSATQQGALEYAVDLARRNQPSQVMLQRTDGQWENYATYEDDPYPPPG